MAITVYHGSTVEIRKPDITFSKKYVDFGKGFYVTTFQKQAERFFYYVIKRKTFKF